MTQVERKNKSGKVIVKLTLSYIRNALRIALTTVGLLIIWLKAGSQTYFLNGDAEAIGNNCYNLTQEFQWESGTVWYADQIDLAEPFSLEFYMNFGDLDANGADGMVFVLQTNGTSAIGAGGDGIGFAGFTPSFGIEFDTWDNSSQSNNGDLTSDHVAFLKNGNVNHYSANNLAGPVQASGMSTNIEDGQDHIIQITWNPQTQIVELYVDCMLRLSDQNDLINSIFNGSSLVYWGFTGATGGEFNVQTVCLSEFFINAEDEFLICEGEQVSIAASGNPDGTFSWSPSINLDDAASQTTFAYPASSTEYCCTYTDLCGNQSQECIWVEVESPPLLGVDDNDEYCEGENYQINATSDTPGAIYVWTTDIGTIVSGINTLSPEVTGDGMYYLEAISPLGVCSSIDSISVNEIPLPVIEPESPVFLCPDSVVVLDAGDGWDEVLWPGNVSTQTLEINTPGNYLLTVTENDCTNSVTIVVTEVNLPTIELGPDQVICSGNQIEIDAGIPVEWNMGLTASSIFVGIEGTYSFFIEEQGCSVQDEVYIEVQQPPVVLLNADNEICEGETTMIESNYIGVWNTSESSDVIEVNTSGFYSIQVTEGVCTANESISIDVIPLPTLELGPDVTYCQGETITLSAVEPYNTVYLWNTGSTEPTIETSQPGVFYVAAGNDCGTLTDSITVSFEECNFGFYIPNSFTPDNDGINDIWKIEYFNLTKAKLTIFNHWGDPVFVTDDLDVPWTGDVHSGDFFAPDGVYVYQLEYWTSTGDAAFSSGHITLIR
ncbi:MAG: lectin-like domain-containing protein [Flavobacteriales bacterium]